VEAEVSGFAAKDLNIDVESRLLRISGKDENEREEQKAETIYTESCADEIARVIYLPAEVDPSRTTATLKDGLLTVNLAKAARAQSVRV